MHSRDGWLPPGVTDQDIDEAAPGYWDEYVRSEFEEVGEILDRMEQDAAMLCGKGYKCAVMTSVENIIRDCKLDRFGK